MLPQILYSEYIRRNCMYAELFRKYLMCRELLNSRPLFDALFLNPAPVLCLISFHIKTCIQISKG